ncbi:MAG: AAA family ATPase [Candidatus Eremiobacteraeota bacterium]|nr:AAA family ATPase [Candidatus Eremiobacteraeota bacterium]MCW5870839.1 AAA family ATPase [Candidatus Eremiobacteraeota bacterium]
MKIGPLHISLGKAPARLRPSLPGPLDSLSLGNVPEASGLLKPPAADPFPLLENRGFTLANLGGNSPARAELQQLVGTLRDGHKAPYSSYLVKGNTGAGKTTLIRGLAADLEKVGVPTLHADGADFSESGPAKLRQLFQQAQQAALKSPHQTAVVHIDEIEAAARIRSQSANLALKVGAAVSGALSGLAGMVGLRETVPKEDPAESHQTLAALTSLMEKNTNLIFIGTTSRADTMDYDASKRFQRELQLDTPSGPEERLSLLQSMVQREKLEVEPGVLEEMARATIGANPLGLEKGLRQAKVLGNGKITGDSAREARLQESFGVARPVTNPDWMWRLTICHEMGHVVVRHLFEDMAKDHPDQQPKGIDAVSFAPRGPANAAVFLKSSSNPASTFEWYMAEVASNLAGRTSESLFGKGHTSAGPGSDITYASKLVKEAIREKGMGLTLGPVNPGISGSTLDETKASQDQERFTAVADQIATSAVEFYRDFTENFAQEMLGHRNDLGKLTLSGQEIQNRLRAWETERAAQVTALKDQIRQAMASIKPPTSAGLK